MDNFGGRRWRGIRRQAVGRQSTVQSVDNDMEVAARERARGFRFGFRRNDDGAEEFRGNAAPVRSRGPLLVDGPR